MKIDFTLNDIVTAVVPAVEKSLAPRFEAIEKRLDGHDKRFDAIDKRFDGVDRKFVSLEASLKAHTSMVVDNAIEELAGMTARELSRTR